ncbi:hypothetical protein L596_007511 [Steinernema carpocapsae]|uniref:General transcription and DNA repair factor IIH subunit TFB5 n=1 Tax=Steinernema carpocapsae TaxID=34508 RepID=A0A4V6XWK0_STECR|nr:hypothetical protein L596_007511 [Steinernema carpocapsae]
MVNVKRAVLIKCDPAMRQLIVHLDEQRLVNSSKFIIKELDETHILIDANSVQALEQKLDAVMESLAPDYNEK